MPELRLTLLVVGLTFLVGLAWWELRRPHQVRGSDLPRPAPDPLDRPAERTADWDLPPPSATGRTRSPELDLPRMSARDPEEELPIVEVSPTEFAAFEARAQTPREQRAERTEELPVEDFVADFSEPEARFVDTRFGEDFANDIVPEPPVKPVAGAPVEAPLIEPPPVAMAVDPPSGTVALGTGESQLDGLLDELGTGLNTDPPISDIAVPAGPDGHGSDPEMTVAIAPASAPAPPTGPEAAPGAVVVDWPAADASRVIAVRVISVGEKFSGRAVRLALAAEGFVLGKFDIFHKPATDGRALLSIASLTKPGTFDSHTIDMQRYSGLNLFAVLPGPLPGPAAIDELLACAQVLAQRLRAQLQDDHGAPLNPARTAAMRNLAAAAPA